MPLYLNELTAAHEVAENTLARQMSVDTRAGEDFIYDTTDMMLRDFFRALPEAKSPGDDAKVMAYLREYFA